jgi:hypothetical protein
MPKAAKEFMVGNRMIAAGEEFEIPPGEENEYRANGLIEGEAPDGATPAAATPAAQAETVTSAATPAAPETVAGATGEDEDESKSRKRR